LFVFFIFVLVFIYFVLCFWGGVGGGGTCDICIVWRRDLKLYLYAFHLLKGDMILKIYFVSLLSHFDTG